MEILRTHIKASLELVLKSIIKKPALVLIFVLGLTAFFLSSLLQLKVNPKWTNALPHTDTLVNEYLKLVEDPMRGSVVYAVIEGIDKEKVSDVIFFKHFKYLRQIIVFELMPTGTQCT